jgi:hypothetical protein
MISYRKQKQQLNFELNAVHAFLNGEVKDLEDAVLEVDAE